MIALPGIVIQDKIYKSLHSLVCQGIRAQDGRSSQGIQIVSIGSRHLMSQGAPSAINEVSD